MNHLPTKPPENNIRVIAIFFSLQFSLCVPVVDCANLSAEDLVQDLGEGKGEGRGHEHEELGQPDGLGAHRKTVPRADGLAKRDYTI